MASSETDSNIGTISQAFVLASDPANASSMVQLEALQRLRYLKTRNTGESIQIPDTSSRDRILLPDFNKYTYEELSMRRKTEVLRQQNTSNESSNGGSKKLRYANVAKSKKTQLQKSRILEIRKFIAENPNKSIIKEASSAGIRGGLNEVLYYDPSIPLFKQL